MNLTEFNEGGTHEENPLGGVPQGVLNRVEEGETKDENYIFSDRLLIDEKTAKEFGIPKKFVGKSFAEVSKKFFDASRKNQYIDKNTYRAMIQRLKMAQEYLKNSFIGDQNITGQYLTGGELMMLAPIATNVFNTALSIFNKPSYLKEGDYTINPVVRENLIDRTQIERSVENQASNARRAITDVSSGNAAFLASNLYAQQQNAASVMAEANLKADLADAQEKARVDNILNQTRLQNAQIRLGIADINAREKGAYISNISKNLASLSQSLGLLGRQEVMKEILANSLGYTWKGDYVGKKKSTENSLSIENNEQSQSSTEKKEENPNAKFEEFRKKLNQDFMFEVFGDDDFFIFK
ncbi:MAG: hypothetical protein QXJ28_02770 [Candidatus Pacearchaeota archaeon]